MAVLTTWMIFIGALLGNTASALKCFSCLKDECAPGGGWIVECPKVNSVCVYYKDITGRALKKGADYVYRRQCGAGPEMSETKCKKATVNFDICYCSEDLCNGDPNAPPPPTTTPIPITTTGNSTTGNNTSCPVCSNQGKDAAKAPASG